MNYSFLPDKDHQIDRLLERLSVVNDPDDAADIELELWSIWAESGQAPINHILESAMLALGQSHLDIALTLMNAVIELAPQFAEGWNRRATVYIVLQDYEAALKDLNVALTLEPRHFGAVWSLSLVYEALGETEAALAELLRAQTLNPHLTGLDERLGYLEGSVQNH